MNVVLTLLHVRGHAHMHNPGRAHAQGFSRLSQVVLRKCIHLKAEDSIHVGRVAAPFGFASEAASMTGRSSGAAGGHQTLRPSVFSML
eukprot:1806186-Pyramimonas_sp.AAC.1